MDPARCDRYKRATGPLAVEGVADLDVMWLLEGIGDEGTGAPRRLAVAGLGETRHDNVAKSSTNDCRNAVDGRHEVDLLAELRAGKLVAFEVKAGAADLPAVRHLTWLRERLGERFARGVVLHTGPRAYELDDRIIALPICALWG